MTRAVTPILVACVPLLAIGLAAPASAQSKTCHSEILRLQDLLDQNGGIIPDMKESDFATTHHQPTADSVAAAKEVAASQLARKLGRETLPFKVDVRKLKKLGLTQSFEVGYEISPRGRAYLDATTRKKSP